MARGETTVVKTVVRAERLHNSVNGNPRYRLHFDDATSALTQSDSACAYEITNYPVNGRPLELTLTRAGRVCGIRKIEPIRPMGHAQALGYLEAAVHLFLSHQTNRPELQRTLDYVREAVDLYMGRA